MIDKDQAIAAVETEINQPDLDWPTKQRHAVYDDLTIETAWGWVLFYALHEDFWVAHRDRGPEDNRPYFVLQADGSIRQAGSDDLQQAISEFEASAD